MSTRGRPEVLDAAKREAICGMLSIGCSRRTAAGYVGCAVSTIHNAARRDAAFAERLVRAECQAKVTFMASLYRAAKSPQHWRAAAWALERLGPEEYGLRPPDTFSLQEVVECLEQLAEILIQELPNPRSRQRILKHLMVLGREQPGCPPAPGGASHVQ